MTRGVDMNARDLGRLLAERHKDDVFVPECKTGPSGVGSLRLDGWAMKRSWSTPTTWGYEIKVSRSDFLNDDKWTGYLDCCSEFYWVCPWGLIQPNEVGRGAGLIYATKTGTRLVRKVKAVSRDVQIPESLWRYLLMSRTNIVRDMHEANQETPAEYWHRWLKNRQIDRSFGARVGKAIRQAIEEQIFDVQNENERMKREVGRFESIRDRLRELGFDPERPVHEFAVSRKVQELKQAVPSDLSFKVDSVREDLDRLAAKLREIEDGGQ